MSQEHLEALRAEYAAMSRKDWNTVFSVAHPNFALTTPGGGLEAETIRGVERRAAHLWTMRGARAMKLEIFPRRENALEAAGLSE